MSLCLGLSGPPTHSLTPEPVFQLSKLGNDLEFDTKLGFTLHVLYKKWVFHQMCCHRNAKFGFCTLGFAPVFVVWKIIQITHSIFINFVIFSFEALASLLLVKVNFPVLFYCEEVPYFCVLNKHMWVCPEAKSMREMISESSKAKRYPLQVHARVQFYHNALTLP